MLILVIVRFVFFCLSAITLGFFSVDFFRSGFDLELFLSFVLCFVQFIVTQIAIRTWGLKGK